MANSGTESYERGVTAAGLTVVGAARAVTPTSVEPVLGDGSVSQLCHGCFLLQDGAMRAANLGLKFLLELVALALLSGWGLRTGDGWLAITLGIGAPAVMVLVWGRFCAPRAAGRLPARNRIPLELTIFAIAAALGFVAGLRVAAGVFVVAVVVNAVGLSVYRQWEA